MLPVVVAVELIRQQVLAADILEVRIQLMVQIIIIATQHQMVEHKILDMLSV